MTEQWSLSDGMSPKGLASSDNVVAWDGDLGFGRVVLGLGGI